MLQDEVVQSVLPAPLAIRGNTVGVNGKSFSEEVRLAGTKTESQFKILF